MARFLEKDWMTVGIAGFNNHLKVSRSVTLRQMATVILVVSSWYISGDQRSGVGQDGPRRQSQGGLLHLLRVEAFGGPFCKAGLRASEQGGHEVCGKDLRPRRGHVAPGVSGLEREDPQEQAWLGETRVWGTAGPEWGTGVSGTDRHPQQQCGPGGLRNPWGRGGTGKTEGPPPWGAGPAPSGPPALRPYLRPARAGGCRPGPGPAAARRRLPWGRGRDRPAPRRPRPAAPGPPAAGAGLRAWSVRGEPAVSTQRAECWQQRHVPGRRGEEKREEPAGRPGPGRGSKGAHPGPRVHPQNPRLEPQCSERVTASPRSAKLLVKTKN